MLAKKGPDLVDPRLAKALEHPTRIAILNILWAGPSSPARIQRQLENVSLNLVAHHVKVLKDLECIELVETVTRRGAKERIYRTAGPVVIDDKAWEKITPKLRQPITASILRMISADLGRTLAAGRFDEIYDNHLSRTRLLLDQEGWAEVVGILERMLDELLHAGDKSKKRIESSGETPIPTLIAIIQTSLVEDDPVTTAED